MAIDFSKVSSWITFEYMGESISVEFRLPGRQMYKAYQAAQQLARAKKRNNSAFSDTNVEWAQKLLISFKEKDDNGAYILLDGDKPITNATVGWREYFAEHLPAVMNSLAIEAFAAQASNERKEDGDDFLTPSTE